MMRQFISNRDIEITVRTETSAEWKVNVDSEGHSATTPKLGFSVSGNDSIAQVRDGPTRKLYNIAPARDIGCPLVSESR